MIDIASHIADCDGMTMTWKNGRQLATLVNGNKTMSYTYDSSGMRTTKLLNSTLHTYEYVVGQLLYETRGAKKINYIYDSYGNVLAAIYKPSSASAEQTYYYAHNWRGDVIALYDSTGSLFARYDYDAWGKLLSIKDASGNLITDSDSFAVINPIRYRGYFYDNESGLYYLQSRYYDPTTGRFINADSIIDGSTKFLSCNIFVYAANNPVNCSDPTGKSLIIDWIGSKIEKVFSSSVNTFRNSFENGTVSVGIDATASYIACVNLQAAFVFDSAGYTAFQVTVSGGASTSKGGASVGVAVSESNAPSYRDLEGGSTQYGGSFADGIAGAAEGTLFGEYHEFAANTGIVGVGTPGGEVHLQTGYTSTLWAYNFMTGEWGTTPLME